MRDWDVAHYGRIFNAACKNADMTTIQYPDGKTTDKAMAYGYMSVMSGLTS